MLGLELPLNFALAMAQTRMEGKGIPVLETGVGPRGGTSGYAIHVHGGITI